MAHSYPAGCGEIDLNGGKVRPRNQNRKGVMVPARRIRQCVASGLGAWIVLALTALPEASAKNLPNCDLSSLVLLSESVVLVERFESGGAWYRVKKVYKGKCRLGLEFTLPAFEKGYLVAKNLSKKPWDSEMVLFVRDGSMPRTIVPSGMKPVIEGRVYRFRQLSNPGPYEACLQGMEVRESKDEFAEAPVTLPEFEKDLGRAMARVLKLESVKKGKALDVLLELLGPVKETLIFREMNSWEGLYSDVFTPAVLSALFAGANDEVIIEAAARCRSLEFQDPQKSMSRLEWPVKEERLLQEAEDSSVPLHRRVAALRILAAPFKARWNTPAHTQVAALLRDPQAKIRIAAANYLDDMWPHEISHLDPPKAAGATALVDAMWKAWETEKDATVRTAILSAFNEELGLRATRVTRLPFVYEGCIQNATVYYVYIFPGGENPFPEDTLVFALPVGEGQERSVSLRELHDRLQEEYATAKTPEAARRFSEIARHSASGYKTRTKYLASSYVAFDPPLQPGKYRMWLEARFSTDRDPKLKALAGGPILKLKTTVMEVEVPQH